MPRLDAKLGTTHALGQMRRGRGKAARWRPPHAFLAIVAFWTHNWGSALGGNHSSCPALAARDTRRDRLNWVESCHSWFGAGLSDDAFARQRERCPVILARDWGPAGRSATRNFCSCGRTNRGNGMKAHSRGGLWVLRPANG